MGRVLEDASIPVCAFAWVFQEILTHRCEVLSAQSLFLLKLFLSVCESTSLLFELVLATLALQPESAKFRFDLTFPGGLLLGVPLSWCAVNGWSICVFDWWLLYQSFTWTDFSIEGCGAIFFIWVDVASLWRINGTLSVRSSRINRYKLLSDS